MGELLQIFEYRTTKKVRTIKIDDKIWFVAKDVCEILDLSNPTVAIERLDDDEKGLSTIYTLGGNQTLSIINESGLYHLLFSSSKPEAQKFRKWITGEVIPEIRRTGGYGTVIPIFLRRFSANWKRVDKGYFSVIGELIVRLYGRLEHAGYRMADTAPDGTEIRPDISVGILFPKWLKKHYPDKMTKYKIYMHVLPNNKEVQAREYENSVLAEFLEFVDNVWLKEQAYTYLAERDPRALEFLPKLLA